MVHLPSRYTSRSLLPPDNARVLPVCSGATGKVHSAASSKGAVERHIEMIVADELPRQRLKGK